MRKACCEKDKMNNKGAWSKQEDQKLIDYIRKHGKGSWRTLPKSAGLLRCGKSCRLRWINYLRPDLKRGGFSEDEQDLIIRLHALLGNRWSLIAGRLPGRTDNEVKNYWNSHLRKKLLKMGIDPTRNHRLGHGSPPFFMAVQRSTVVSSTSSSSTLNPRIPPARMGSDNEEKNDYGRNSEDKDVNNVVQSRDASPGQLNLDLTITLPSNPKLSGDHLETANFPTLPLFT